MFFNSSNGLLSRFLVYNVRPISRFKNIFSEPEQVYNTDVIAAYKKHILDNYLYLEKLHNKQQFNLTKEQEEVFVEYFSTQKNLVAESLDDEDSGFINRLALNVYKMMMVLTSIRALDQLDTPIIINCTNEDFFCAIRLYEILREHFFYAFNELLQEKQKYYRDHKELRERISQLRIQKLSYRKISKILGIPLATVHRIQKGY